MKDSEDHLWQIIDTIPILAWCARPDGSAEFFNQHWLEYTGLSAEQALNGDWKVAVHPEDLNGLVEYWRSVVASGEPGEIEGRLRRFDGIYRWFIFRATPWLDEGGRIVKWFATNTDIEERRRSESLLNAEKRTLEMIANGASLSGVLNDLCAAVDAHAPGAVSTVLLMDPDGKYLWPGAGPHFPAELKPAISPWAIGPGRGSCGTAAFLKQRVIISDVTTDARWPDDYRDLAVRHGLRASWSEPLVSEDGAVLGRFAMYYAAPRIPTAGDLELIEAAGNIARIAIERERSRRALTEALGELKRSEGRLQRIIDTIPTLAWSAHPDGSAEFFNQRWLEYTGLSAEEALDWGWKAAVHADDLPRMMEILQQAMNLGQPFEAEGRLRRSDGEFRWFLFRGSPLHDESGRVIKWYGTNTDLEDRKRAEDVLRASEQSFRKENLALRDEVDRVSMFEEIVGTSPTLQVVLSRVVKVAPTDSSVLITGETGTGKELIARAIHKRSQRFQRAFVSVNCAALAPSLISSELFGHEKGAFTGATQRRLGRFELADGGTIFLDEVGELPPDTQVALLRVLQEREFERVGGTQSIKLDVRVIAASNRKLEAAATNGTFRSDLFYRLNVFPIEVPPLRERKDDVLMLLQYFVHRFARKVGKHFEKIEKRTLELFRSYDWPGNIRELQNVVERSVIVSPGDVFCVDEAWLSTNAGRATWQPSPPEYIDEDSTRERQIIEAALVATRGRVSGPNGAAAKLRIPPSTLDSRIKKLNIRKSHFKIA